jgi:branched-chain amino acid transport system ATP-binding protein
MHSIYDGALAKRIGTAAHVALTRVRRPWLVLAAIPSLTAAQAMLALARSLSVDPVVLIIDELSMGLAPLVVEQLYAIVAQLAADRSMAIVIVEQFAHDVLRVATRAGTMAHGRLTTVGDPLEIGARLSDAYLARA